MLRSGSKNQLAQIAMTLETAKINEILFGRFGKRKTYSVCMDTLYELLPFLRERAFALTTSVTPLRF